MNLFSDMCVPDKQITHKCSARLLYLLQLWWSVLLLLLLMLVVVVMSSLQEIEIFEKPSC